MTENEIINFTKQSVLSSNRQDQYKMEQFAVPISTASVTDDRNKVRSTPLTEV
jgi:hypothetical protein